MAKTVLCDATLMAEQGARALQVDIFNLPYGEFDATNPLLIAGDVALGSPKNTPFPDFRNVEIDGCFDCSYYKISSDTVLPRGITSLVCKCSINNLSDLIGVLPDSVQTVVLKSSMLTAIGRDSDAYAAAVEFVARYPNIVVTDGKQTTLYNVMESVAQRNQKQQKPVVESVSQVASVPQKTADYLSREELAIACISCSPALSEIPMESLLRYIKMASSAKSGLRLKSQEMTRPEDGVKINCVHCDCVATVANFIVEKHAQQQERESVQNAVAVAAADFVADQRAERQARATATVKTSNAFCIDGREVSPTKIKKYIPKRLWNQIKGAAGNNKTLLLAILNDIECINVQPADTQGKKVYYIADGELKASRTVDFKNTRCLAQSFGPQNDRPRIVWGMSGDVFVCVNFFPEHCSNTSVLKYRKFIRDFKMDLSEMNLDEYLSVSDLIAEMADSNGKPAPDFQDAPQPVEQVMDEPVPASTPEPVPEPVSAPAPRPRGRPRKAPPASIIQNAQQTVEPIAEQTVAAPISEPEIVPISEPAPEPAPAVIENQVAQPVVPSWVDLYHISAQIETSYTRVLQCKTELLELLATEQEPDKSLELNDALRNVLLRQKRLNDARARILAINEQLKRMREDLVAEL